MKRKSSVSKKKWGLALGICGILVLLSVALSGKSLPNKAAGILVGLGSVSFAMGMTNFLMGRYEERNPGQAKQNEIEERDERNAAIRYRAQAGAGTVLQWVVMGIAWITILADGPLWVTLIMVGAFGAKAVLEFCLMEYYRRRM